MNISLGQVLAVIAIILAVGALFGGSLWVFGPIQLLALAIVLLGIARLT
jgi:hypothetical protein